MHISKLIVDINSLDISHEHQEAISVIQGKKKSHSDFIRNGVSYVIENNPYRGITVAAFGSTNKEPRIGIIHDYTRFHNSIDVDSAERNKGIGSTLFQTKISVDGLLRFETTRRKDRLLFLIKRGYAPIALAGYATNHSDILGWQQMIDLVENDLLGGEGLATDTINSYRLEFLPEKASDISKNLGLHFDYKRVPKLK